MFQSISQLFNGIASLFRWWVLVMPWQSGLRVRLGKRVKVLKPGLHLKVPLIDAIYVQTTRLRVTQMPVQTLTSKCGKTISLLGTVGYTIENIEKLYQTLHQPDSTVIGMAMSAVADYVREHDLHECSAKHIEAAMLQGLKFEQYGLGNAQVRLIGYGVVKTFRFITDHTWMPDGNVLDGRVGQHQTSGAEA